MSATIVYADHGDVQFDPPVRNRRKHVLNEPTLIGSLNRAEGLKVLQEAGSRPIVDRTTVVRIDQAEIPKLSALVKIRYAGCRDFHEYLGERIIYTIPRNLPVKGKEIRQERIGPGAR